MTKKKIEIVGVILILLFICTIASEMIFSVILDSQEKARESSVFGYAEALRLKVYEDTFNVSLSDDDIVSSYLNNMEGYNITCDEIIFNKRFGIILKDCRFNSTKKQYYYALGKVYKDKNDLEFQKIWNYVVEEIK